jgi:hypothetical protein
MTVQDLIDNEIVTLAQLQGFANRKAAGGRGAANPDRAGFAEEVYAILIENPKAEWKNGAVLKTWFPNGKEADAELEKQRVERHRQISRALADLTSDGRLVKERKGESASSTFYRVVEDKMPVAQAEDDAADGDGEA